MTIQLTIPGRSAFLFLLLVMAGSLVTGAACNAGGAQAQTTFTNSNLQGSYAFQAIGSTAVGPQGQPAQPLAAVGLMNFDGKGKLAVTQMVNFNSQILPAAGDGTYTVRADGSGSMTLNSAGGSDVVEIPFVITERDKEFRFIFGESRSQGAPPRVVHGVARRQ